MKTNREERLNYIENKLHQCEADLLRLQEINFDLKRIIENMEELSAYYSNEYVSDYENSEQFKNHYEALNQDSIWNVMTDQRIEKIQLLKTVINSIES